mgnify:CR=1 FL=1
MDASVFTLLFDKSTDIHQFEAVADQVYQSYSNSLFFYFREEDEDDLDNEAEDEAEEDSEE